MKISKDASRIAHRIYRLCAPDGKLDEEKIRFSFNQIAEKKPRAYREILHALLRLVRLDEESRNVTIESAVELDSESRTRIEKNLTDQYGEGLRFSYQINPDLLGGTRIRVGNDVWDGSVQSRLNRLANAF